MAKDKTNNKVTIPEEEYNRLKSLESKFSSFLSYVEEVESVKEAREDIKKGNVVEQEELFEKLGI